MKWFFAGLVALAGLLLSATILAGDEVPQSAANGSGQTAQAALGQDVLPALSPEEMQTLRLRATARWDALFKRDFNLAYAFTSPAYREVYTAQQYAVGFGRDLDWQRVEVLQVQATGPDTALVIIRVFFKTIVDWANDPFEASAVTEESWVKSADQWWLLPKSKV